MSMHFLSDFFLKKGKRMTYLTKVVLYFLDDCRISFEFSKLVACRYLLCSFQGGKRLNDCLYESRETQKWFQGTLKVNSYNFLMHTFLWRFFFHLNLKWTSTKFLRQLNRLFFQYCKYKRSWQIKQYSSYFHPITHQKTIPSCILLLYLHLMKIPFDHLIATI